MDRREDHDLSVDLSDPNATERLEQVQKNIAHERGQELGESEGEVTENDERKLEGAFARADASEAERESEDALFDIGYRLEKELDDRVLELAELVKAGYSTGDIDRLIETQAGELAETRDRLTDLRANEGAPELAPREDRLAGMTKEGYAKELRARFHETRGGMPGADLTKPVDA